MNPVPTCEQTDTSVCSHPSKNIRFNNFPMKIAVCGSMAFARELKETQKTLEKNPRALNRLTATYEVDVGCGELLKNFESDKI